MKSPSFHSLVLGSSTPYRSYLLSAWVGARLVELVLGVEAVVRVGSRDRRSIERLDPNLGVDDMSHALHTLQPLQGSEQGPHRLSTCLGGMRGGGGASDGGPT